jgi:glycosyltransferase involved in cell wall biosynthesis
MNEPIVRRGSRVDPAPEISVIVIAIHGDHRAVDAIRSLHDERVRTELILVNTGGGSVACALGPLIEHVVLVECARVHLPGGARNLGVSLASAPIIAFLASDCLATPGWLASRLAAHEHAAAVASAVRPAPVGARRVSLASWASYGLLHCRRAPECPQENALRYGLSYRREIFTQYGAFLEDRRIGEDTEFNDRLSGSDRPLWQPDIVTLHRYPTTTDAAVADAFRRGRNLYRWVPGSRFRAALRCLRRAAGSAWNFWSFIPHARGDTKRALLVAAPVTMILVVSYALGAVFEATQPQRRTARYAIAAE